MSATEEILYAVADGIGTITLNRPQARNALTFAMYERIGEICAAPEAFGNPRVIVMTGAGHKAFAAGTDISQFRDFKTKEDALAYEERVEAILNAIEACPVPTIAAIAGAVTGGGAAIAACCDLRIATEDARFGFPIARTLGNCLSLRNYARLVGLLGATRVKDIIFTARLMDASEGKAVGLYNQVVPNHEAMIAATHAMAAQIATHAPLTLRATKLSLQRIAAAVAPEDSSDLLLMCYLSADFREGMEAFLGKRTPNWQGR